MTTRRQRRLEETQPTLGEDSSSDAEAEYQTVPENSEEERQLLSADNDTVEVASTTNDDDDIIIDEVNIAVTAQLNSNSVNGNGTAGINHGLNAMSVSDKVKRAISDGSDVSSSASTLPQDVEMHNTAPNETNESKDDNLPLTLKDFEEEKGEEEDDSPKTEKVTTAEPLAIASGSKDQVVNIKYADLAALITTIATKINVPPSAPTQETIKFKEPEVAAKKQEVKTSLKFVLLKGLMNLFTQHRFMYLYIRRYATTNASIRSSLL